MAQKLIRFMGLAALVVMALFPPWQTIYTIDGAKQSASAGYRPLWNPPSQEVELPDEATDPAHRINLVRLGIQLGVVLLLMNASLFLMKQSKKST